MARQHTIPGDYLLGGQMLRKYRQPRERMSYYEEITRDDRGNRVNLEYPPEHEKRVPPAVTAQVMIHR